MANPESTDCMKDLIEFIAKALVDHPDHVQVSEVEGERTSVIELTVAKDDLGKVIGKQGRTARAIRTILSAASTKIRKRSVLEIINSRVKDGSPHFRKGRTRSCGGTGARVLEKRATSGPPLKPSRCKGRKTSWRLHGSSRAGV